VLLHDRERIHKHASAPAARYQVHTVSLLCKVCRRQHSPRLDASAAATHDNEYPTHQVVYALPLSSHATAALKSTRCAGPCRLCRPPCGGLCSGSANARAAVPLAGAASLELCCHAQQGSPRLLPTDYRWMHASPSVAFTPCRQLGRPPQARVGAALGSAAPAPTGAPCHTTEAHLGRLWSPCSKVPAMVSA